ncbi:MAG: 2-oxoglutarate and iron-dependent oxygenase domain-containing protein, partial [Wenzhouxiangella sp.]
MSSDGAGIPVLSMSAFSGRSDDFSRNLGLAWREFGFVGIRDHGVDDGLIERAYTVFREFFALPAPTKQAFHQPGRGGARGYTGFGIEQARDHSVPDLKEFWHVGREFTTDNPMPEV